MKNKLIKIAVIATVGLACYKAGEQNKYNEIRERANTSNQFGEGYFTSLDVEEIVEGYEDDEEGL
tara:strand:- start:515 stop:709 length:195 start_codon:yes stop_codon:yes gene_type:complete